MRRACWIRAWAAGLLLSGCGGGGGGGGGGSPPPPAPTLGGLWRLAYERQPSACGTLLLDEFAWASVVGTTATLRTGGGTLVGTFSAGALAVNGRVPGDFRYIDFELRADVTGDTLDGDVAWIEYSAVTQQATGCTGSDHVTGVRHVGAFAPTLAMTTLASTDAFPAANDLWTSDATGAWRCPVAGPQVDTLDVVSFAWSPSRTFLAFTTLFDASLHVVPAAGGPSHVVATGLRDVAVSDDGRGPAAWAWSSTDRLLWVEATPDAATDALHVVEADGTGDVVLDAPVPLAQDGGAVFSPDGSRVAYVGFAPDGDGARVVVVAATGGNGHVVSAPFLDPPGPAATTVSSVAWDAAGQRVAFTTRAVDAVPVSGSTHDALFVAPAAGSAVRVFAPAAGRTARGFAWLDGAWLAHDDTASDDADSVLRVVQDDGTGARVVATLAGATAFARGGGGRVVFGAGGGTVESVPAVGGTPDVLATATFLGVTADGARAVVASGPVGDVAVAAVPVAGGAATTLASHVGPAPSSSEVRASFPPTGSRVLVLGSGTVADARAVRLVDAATAVTHASLALPASPMPRDGWSTDGTAVAVRTTDGALTWLSSATGATPVPTATLRRPDASPTDVVAR